MSGTDERIVRMKFDNAQFKKAATDTQAQLDGLDKAVTKAGGSKGLMDMGKQMEQVSVKAGAMQVAAVTAIANIANRAVNAGITLAKSLNLDPLKQGFQEYELKMKSIQTILANTTGESLKTVTAALQELNTYADKTIYNFAAMTDNIGKMTTAGIDLKTATATVKGFSNMAALAGANAQATAGAMEQFAQGLQAGTIQAIDWMSLSNRGLGSQALQKAFFETARAAGKLKDIPLTTTFEEWVKANGGFKASLKTGWLTTETATDALKIMTGDVKSVQTLIKQGFDPKTARDMLKIADNALESATKVRTFTAFMDTLKEQIGSGWAQVFEKLFGNFNQATSLFTAMSNATGKFISGFFNYLTTLLNGFNKLGGRTAVLETIHHLLAPIGAILGVVAKAWKAAFPAREAGGGLTAVAKALEFITRPLEILADVIEGSVGPLTAFFQILKIGKTAISEAGQFIGDFVKKLFGMVDLGASAGTNKVIDFFKKLAEAVGDALQQISDLIDKGESLKDAFSKVKFNMPDLPNLPSLGGLSLPGLGGPDVDAGGITGKFGLAGMAVKDLTNQFGGLNDMASEFNLSGVTKQTDQVTASMDAATGKSETLGDKLGPIFASVKDKIAQFMGSMSFDDLMASFNLAVLSTFVISLSRMFNTMSKSFEGFIGTGEAINGILDNAGNALKSFQTQARANLILKIAIAIGILALALALLSRIPADKLLTALTALAGVAAVLNISMKGFADTIEKLDKKKINSKMLALGASMVLFSISVLILAAAMKKMNEVDWDSVLKAGVAMYALVKAMEKISEMKSDGIVKSAFAMILISGALLLFAVAIKKFAALDFATFAEGLLYASVALASLVFILHGFESSLGGAAAMVVAVGALFLLAEVIEKMAGLKWSTFFKGMTMVVLALAPLVVLLYAFESSLAGAAAILVVAYSLGVLVKVIEAFAKLDWGVFFKGLGMLVILVGTMTLLMAIMGVLSPLILLGAAAILIFGGAMFLLGTGIAALAKGMTGLIAISGGVVAAISAFAVGAAIGFGVFLQTLALQAPIMKDSILKILQALIDTIVGAVPMIIDGAKRLWDAVMKELGGEGKGGEKQAAMQATGKSWLQKLSDGIKKMLPKIVDTAVDLGVRFIQGLSKNAGKIASAGVDFVIKLIEGIDSRIGKITSAAVDLIIHFAESLEDNLARLVNAGISLIAEFLHDLADAIRNGSKAIGGGLKDVVDAFFDVGKDLVQGLIDGLGSMLGDALGAINDLVGDMIDAAKSKLKIFSPSKVFMSIGQFLVKGLTKGIQNNASAAIVAVASMVSGQIAVASEYINKFLQDLDQKAIAASARAEGLRRAAELAAKAAEKTKSKKDDKAANKLADKAEEAAKKADRAESRAEKAKEREERAQQFEDATLLEKAQMRSEDAQNQMDAAKQAEFKAASKLAQAEALRQQAKEKGVSEKQAKEMRKLAAKLEEQARAQAKIANQQIAAAKLSAEEALEFQRQAGEEAAKLFQERFDAEAKADADEEAFNKLSDAEKAAERRRQSDELQAKATADLQRAKELAYTDLQAANDLAEQAMQEADQARAFLLEAQQLEQQRAQGTQGSQSSTGGTVVNLDPTEAAAIAFGNYSDLYDMATAAAAGGRSVEFNQYNTSPEALNPTEIYRLTNNQFTFALEKLDEPAA